MILDALYIMLKKLFDTRIKTLEANIAALEVEATAIKNEILDNKALMYLQAAQISPNTYTMNAKRLLEFASIKECRDLYINSYTDFKNKLLYPAARLKVAGVVIPTTI